MQSLVKHSLYLFLGITAITAVITLFGIVYIWFFANNVELPHLTTLITSIIIEMGAVIFILAKKGIKYLPDTQIDQVPKDTLKFMEKFISSGTNASIVSNRLSWLIGDEVLISTLQSKIESGTRIEIITPNEIPDKLKERLKGASFIVTNETIPPEARFTLINGDRSGAEKLAISRGVHPDHEITIFDNSSGPQIIAMAKDIIRKSRILANAS